MLELDQSIAIVEHNNVLTGCNGDLHRCPTGLLTLNTTKQSGSLDKWCPRKVRHMPWENMVNEMVLQYTIGIFY